MVRSRQQWRAIFYHLAHRLRHGRQGMARASLTAGATALAQLPDPTGLTREAAQGVASAKGLLDQITTAKHANLKTLRKALGKAAARVRLLTESLQRKQSVAATAKKAEKLMAAQLEMGGLAERIAKAAGTQKETVRHLNAAFKQGFRRYLRKKGIDASDVEYSSAPLTATRVSQLTQHQTGHAAAAVQGPWRAAESLDKYGVRFTTDLAKVSNSPVFARTAQDLRNALEQLPASHWRMVSSPTSQQPFWTGSAFAKEAKSAEKVLPGMLRALGGDQALAKYVRGTYPVGEGYRLQPLREVRFATRVDPTVPEAMQGTMATMAQGRYEAGIKSRINRPGAITFHLDVMAEQANLMKSLKMNEVKIGTLAAHEFGHALDLGVTGGRLSQKLWDRAPQEVLSHYAGTKPIEKFPEAYAMYASPRGRKVMRARAPRTYQFMQQVFAAKTPQDLQRIVSG